MTSLNRHVILSIGCVVALAMLLVRSGSLLGGTTPLWALNFPAFLSPTGKGVVVLATVAVAGMLRWALALEPPTMPSRPRSIVGLMPWLVMALLVATCLSLPDRAWFLGDYSLRIRGIQEGNYADLFAHSLPLDSLLNGYLIPLASSVTGLPAPLVARLSGAIAYTALLILVHAMTAADGRSGFTSLASLLMLGGSGIVSLYTGFPRDTIYVLPLALALLLALGARTDAKRALSPWPELLLTALLLLHRSALLLAVPYLVVTASALRSANPIMPRGRSWRAALILLVIATLGLVPTYLRVLFTFDLPLHFVWMGRPASHDALGALVSTLPHVLNALLVLSPSALLALLPRASTSPPEQANFERAVLASVLVVLLLFRPQQGAFRDYDVYALAALMASVVGCGRLLPVGGPATHTSTVLAFITAVSSVQGAVAVALVANDPTATRVRIESALTQTSAFSTLDRARWLDYLGDVATREGAPEAAARDFGRAADLLPTPLRVVRAARSFAGQRDYEHARTYFERLIHSQPGSALGWCGYAGMSAALGDSLALMRSSEAFSQLARDHRQVDVMLRLATQSPELDPTGLVRKWLRGLPSDPDN